MSIKIAMLVVVGLALLAASAVHAAEPAKGSGNPVVVLDTSLGTIKLELFQEQAPITVKNFLAYMDDKHYDGTVFHRVMGKENSDRDFMIQGGGFDTKMNQKKTKPAIKNESVNNLKNLRGTVAMARTSDVDSATSQFFINVVDNSFLDKSEARDGAGYCVFAKVIDGMDVVDKIKAVETGVDPTTRMPNVPKKTVEIKTVKLDKK
jgi:cyclophilin family peptidyl-prolyl cis-trans isomerase